MPKTQAATPAIVSTRGDLGANVASFVRHLKAENKSPRTIETYTESANQLGAFLTRAGMPTDVARITREHVESFITHLLETKLPSTANLRYRGLQALFKWLQIEGEIKTSPMMNMKPPRIPETVVPVLSESQIDALFKACQGNDFAERRDMAILRFVATTGCRRAELADLRSSENDLDLDSGVARVRGKGGRDRLVPLDPRTVRALDRYLRVRASHSDRDLPWLWLGIKGRLTQDGIRQMLERRAAQAGLGHIHLHQLRHSFAHAWLADGGQESDLMRLAGWRSPQMVRRYAASAGQERAINAARRVGLGARI